MAYFDEYYVENCEIFYKDFSGRHNGKRKFSLYINNEDLLENLRSDGVPIKMREEYNNPDNPPRPYIDVEVTFHDKNWALDRFGNEENSELKVIIVNSKGKRVYTDRNVLGFLDTSRLKDINMVIRPGSWKYQNKEGVKVWLEEMGATKIESKMELKYKDIPDINETTDINFDEIPNE